MYAVTHQPAGYGSDSSGGLECLARLDEVRIKQKVSQHCAGVQNKFLISDQAGRQILYAEDDRSGQQKTTRITDNSSNVILQLTKSINFCGTDLQILSAYGTLMSNVETTCSGCNQMLILQDDRGNALATIGAGWLDNFTCGDLVWQIRDPRGYELAQLIFEFAWCSYRNFRIVFRADLDHTTRALLLGGSLMFIAGFQRNSGTN